MQLISMDNNPGPPHSQPLAGSQIRSRVTVVCAECKRLKLKCDRRTPCSSCLKRDTVPRCTYSAAAAEKIDVQSLHNRVLVLEAQLTQLTSGGMKLSPHEIDHALLAVGASGSSVLVPLDDVAGVWIEDLDLRRESGIELQPAFPDTVTDPEAPPTLGPDSSPQSHSGSTHNSPHPTTTAPLPFCPLSQRSAKSVTPELLALLPPAAQHPALLEVLGSVLRMHPSLNFPHFRARINAMFSDKSYPGEIGIGPSCTNTADKPSLSFFAAAAAGFALAMQCMPHAASLQCDSSPQASTSTLPTQTPSVSSLLALSAHALDLAEDIAPYDLDFLHALILRCLSMLHDGMPRVSQAVFANVGKMVNVARMMGLARDPDEFASSSKYTLWDAEMRRRMWWDVFYYDLFVSDCMGLPPLISDDQHTCRMPADVDEDAFVPNSAALPQPADHPSATNFSYFLQKCKLAQLVKNTKKRTSPVPSSSGGSTPATSEPSLDAASQAESEIQQYLSDLPPAFKLDVDADLSDPDSTAMSPRLSPSPSDNPSPHLVVQRCELFTLAHQLVLKLFHPFLRRSNVRPPHNAMVACINATHAIIQASRIARDVWYKHSSAGTQMGISPGTGPGTNIPSSHGVFYPFARQLFDATIIAAHVVIQAPQSVFAKVALDDVRTALEVLRDPAIATGRGRSPSRGGVEGCPSEAVRIVEMMMRKAEIAKRHFTPVAAGTKRKHEEVDANLGKGFWLPYVGTGVATDAAHSGSSGGATSLPTPTRSSGHSHGSPRAKLSDKSSVPEHHPHHQPQQRGCVAGVSPRDREKERKYPVVGIRNRNAGVLGDRLCVTSGLRSRREPSVPPQQQPAHSDDSGGYATPAAPPPSSSATMQAGSIRGTTGEFALQAPYALEDAHMVNMTVPPAASTFTTQSQPHSYSTPSFKPARTSESHQPMYNSRPYTSNSTPQSVPSPFYVSYQHQPPTAPSPQSTYRPIDEHPHSQHPHLGIAPMAILQNQTAMDTSDLPRLAKQEEGTEHRDSDAAGSPFGAPEGWSDAGVPARFSTQTTWDPRYGY